jgi:hypothetical protein
VCVYVCVFVCVCAYVFVCVYAFQAAIAFPILTYVHHLRSDYLQKLEGIMALLAFGGVMGYSGTEDLLGLDRRYQVRSAPS